MQGTHVRRWAPWLALAIVAAPAAARAQGGAGAPDTRPTVAVLSFDNSAMVRRDEYAPLSQGIADMLITELSASPRIRVIEREQVQQILDEQNLGASGRVDKETLARVGRILGARYMITGGFVVDPRETVRLDARTFNVETSEIDSKSTVSVTGKAENILALIGEVGQRLGDRLRLPALVPAVNPGGVPGAAAAGNAPATGAAGTAGGAASGSAGGAAGGTARGATHVTPRIAPQADWTPSKVSTTASAKKIDQKRAILLLGRAIGAEQRGDKAIAAENYRAALEVYPDFGRARVLLASLERPRGT